MKKILFILLLMCIAFNANSQDQKLAIELFKKKINQVDSVFIKSPTFLKTEEFSSSNSGQINYLIKIVKIESLSYDIQSTNSIVSPYIAYIVLKIQVLSNQSLGNVKNPKLPDYVWGFETAEQAHAMNILESCTNCPKYNPTEWCIGEIKINFAMQDGVWVFKNINTEVLNKIKNGSSRGAIAKELPKFLH